MLTIRPEGPGDQGRIVAIHNIGQRNGAYVNAGPDENRRINANVWRTWQDEQQFIVYMYEAATPQPHGFTTIWVDDDEVVSRDTMILDPLDEEYWYLLALQIKADYPDTELWTMNPVKMADATRTLFLAMARRLEAVSGGIHLLTETPTEWSFALGAITVAELQAAQADFLAIKYPAPPGPPRPPGPPGRPGRP